MNEFAKSFQSKILRGDKIIFFILAAAAFLGPNNAKSAGKAEHASRQFIQKWPYSFPCRVHEGANKDLFVMTLGDVKTTLADGVFNPLDDEVTLNDGRVIRNYYRDSLGIEFFKLIDKSKFPLPPSGWCSWYYYYQSASAKEIERNAWWIAKNLKSYGANYVQIDDGWQGKGHGSGENRDWTTIAPQFTSGMDKLAAYIKSLGLEPGLWLAPQGQSNTRVVKHNPGAFLMNADTSVSNTWEGMYLVDPSSKAGLNYLKNLFTMLKGWGYRYFKIDGQPTVIDEYRLLKPYMKHPADNADSLYRATIRTMKRTIGDKCYLLGCGVTIDGIGIDNGSRTGGDVVLGWNGFMTSVEATMDNYFLHNIAWYCDPDVMILRYPLTLDQARAWATLQGLTGQALMSSDRLPDLSTERVDILKSVFPAQNIRPLDLFPSRRLKHIWDLKINHLGKNYDVVGVFDFNETKSKTLFLKWKEFGYSDTSLVHVFDFWNKEYLGTWKKGMSVTVSPTSCRVLTLLRSNGHIQLISTNRHITQGYPDLVSLRTNSNVTSFYGESKVIANAPYELYFVFPRGKNFVVDQAIAGNLKVKVDNHQGWAKVEFISHETASVKWMVSFTHTSYYHYPVYTSYRLSVTTKGLEGAFVQWLDYYGLNLGNNVYLNGKLVGYTPTNVFPLTGLDPDSICEVSVKSIWEDGTESSKAASALFELKKLLPERIELSSIRPDYLSTSRRVFRMNKAMSGNEISIGGARYEHGIGTQANSEIFFKVHALYAKFTSTVGLDDSSSNRNGMVEFLIYGDGRELWHSDIITGARGAVAVSVDIKGVRQLLLKVVQRGDRAENIQADWARAQLDGLIR